eukprot:2984520-Prymnesium_polylepis.1
MGSPSSPQCWTVAASCARKRRDAPVCPPSAPSAPPSLPRGIGGITFKISCSVRSTAALALSTACRRLAPCVSCGAGMRGDVDAAMLTACVLVVAEATWPMADDVADGRCCRQRRCRATT